MKKKSLSKSEQQKTNICQFSIQKPKMLKLIEIK